MTDDPRALAAQLLAASRFAMPLKDVLEHIRKRRAAYPSPPLLREPDVAAPELISVPLIDDPDRFAELFWKKRTATKVTKLPSKTAKPRVSRTQVPPTPAHPTLRLIDGGKGNSDGGGDNSDETS